MAVVTNPISADQVLSVNIDWKCLEVPCPNLKNGMQAIVDHICDTPDFTTLDFGCVTASDSLLGTLQSTLDAINGIGCAPLDGSTVIDATDLLLAGLTTCSSDSWTCDSVDACLDFTNDCDPGVITVGLVSQKLIDRSVAYGNVIKDLCDRISDLEALVAAQQLTITTIQSSCCP
jgi:hypothetical protein